MILRVDGIDFGYASRSTIRNVTFSVEAGDMLTIMGPNGVGKTTLLKCLNRILAPRSGKVWIDGKDARSMRRIDLAKRIGYVAQRGEVSRLTVYDLILLGRRPQARWGMSEQDHVATARVIELLGLSDLALRYADEISGGEFQLAQVARALAQEPRVIVLDEPTSNLDISNQHRLLSKLERIVTSSAMSSIMTNHDINLSIRYSNKLVLMKDGTIFAAGGREIITEEHIRAVYDIDVHVGTLHGIPFVLPK
jgi:iron complex transport system ATP-binding protein